MVLFAKPLFGPLDGDLVIAGVGLDPVAVIVSALTQHLLAHDRDTQNLTDEMDHLLGAGQAAEIAMDDDAVEAMVYKNQQVAK